MRITHQMGFLVGGGGMMDPVLIARDWLCATEKKERVHVGINQRVPVTDISSIHPELADGCQP